MAKEEKINGAGKIVTATMVGVIVTLMGGWMTIGREIVSREEIGHQIQKESPYVQDKNMILRSLDKIDAMYKDFNAIQIRNARIEEKVDLLLENNGK